MDFFRADLKSLGDDLNEIRNDLNEIRDDLKKIDFRQRNREVLLIEKVRDRGILEGGFERGGGDKVGGMWND